MRVFLAGATGAIGRRLVPLLVERGHHVFAITRDPERSKTLASSGVTATVCDVFDRAQLRDHMHRAEPDIIVNQLTSIPPRINPRRIRRVMAPTNRLRIEGTDALVTVGCQLGVSRFVSQSMAFAYAPRSGLAVESEPLYLDAPRAFAPLIRAAARCEEITMGSPGTGIVLRYGFFCGPSTAYAADGTFAEDVRLRRVPLVGSASGVFSFVHVDDAAMATALAMERGDPGIFNVVDDEPVPMNEWLPAYARRLKTDPPRRVPRIIARVVAGPYGDFLATRLRGASNAQAKERLGWTPRFTWKDALG